ncbi:MAG: type IX secretion system outer membrane channel protein PorV [Flavobacteriales bacterium]|nr:type IX secretion system outer membrane channel protein PorV [Flavobacteriales bacterium]
MSKPMRITAARIALVALCVHLGGASLAQSPVGATSDFSRDSINSITTAVPFMMISGNARQMGMGDLGVVSSDQFVETAFTSNAALLATGRRYVHAETNYTPWLRALVADMYLLSGSVAWGITETHAVGVHVKYFNLGNIYHTDVHGQRLSEIHAYEFMVQANYAAQLGKGFSIGTSLKYVHSDLTNGLNVGGVDTKAGQSVAGDLGLNYRGLKRFKDSLTLGYSAGLGLNNIGSKMSYSNLNESDFLPMNMQLGVMLNLATQKGNVRIENDLGYQVTKLLVPTPPQYLKASNSNVDSTDVNGNRIIAAGKNPNVSVPAAIFQSFGDAPGGSLEEWNEVTHHVGHELRMVFNDRLSGHIREGFFYEHHTKGNRQWVSLGGGFGWFGFRVDVAYLIPLQMRSPIEDTFSVSLTYRARMGKVNKMRFPKIDPKDERLELMEALLIEGSDEKGTE